MYSDHHSIVLAGKLWQTILRATDKEWGVGCILPDDLCTKTGQPVVELLWENRPNSHVPPLEDHTCTSFEEY